MEIERLLENLDQEEMEKLLPMLCEYLRKLSVEDYIVLYDKVEERIKKG